MVDKKTTNDESPEDPIALAPKLVPFAEYLGKPAAVQLKTPLIGVDATMESGADGRLPVTEDGDSVLRYITTKGIGWPALAPQRGEDLKPLKGDAAKPKMEVVLFGELRPTRCGTRLFILRPSDSGAALQTLLSPESIDYVTLIVAVPPAEVIRDKRIVAP